MGVRKPIPKETATAVIATAQASTLPLTAIIGGAVGAYCVLKTIQFSYNLYQIHKKNYQLEDEIESGKKYLNFSIEKDSANRFINGFANILIREKEGSLFIFRESSLFTESKIVPNFIKKIINKRPYQPIGIIKNCEDDKLKINQITSEKESGFNAFRSVLSKIANFIPLFPRTSHLKVYENNCNLSNFESYFNFKNLGDLGRAKISWWQKLKAVISPSVNDENELLLRKICFDRSNNIKDFYQINYPKLYLKNKSSEQNNSIDLKSKISLQDIKIHNKDSNNSFDSQKQIKQSQSLEEDKSFENLIILNNSVFKQENNDNNILYNKENSKSSINSIESSISSQINNISLMSVKENNIKQNRSMISNDIANNFDLDEESRGVEDIDYSEPKKIIRYQKFNLKSESRKSSLNSAN